MFIRSPRLLVSIHSYPAWGRRHEVEESMGKVEEFQSTPTPRGVGDVTLILHDVDITPFQSTPTPRGVGDV